MKAKKTKLPEKLYHYTDPIKYRMILATGKLLLTPSNLKYDNATLHDEPLFFNGQKIGYAVQRCCQRIKSWTAISQEAIAWQSVTVSSAPATSVV